MSRPTRVPRDSSRPSPASLARPTARGNLVRGGTAPRRREGGPVAPSTDWRSIGVSDSPPPPHSRYRNRRETIWRFAHQSNDRSEQSKNRSHIGEYRLRRGPSKKLYCALGITNWA